MEEGEGGREAGEERKGGRWRKGGRGRQREVREASERETEKRGGGDMYM